jgi:hypothetical protein
VRAMLKACGTWNAWISPAANTSRTLCLCI